MEETDLRSAIETVRSILASLGQGEFSENLYKVSVYVESVAKSWEAFSSGLADLETKSVDAPGKIDQAMQLGFKKFQANLKNSLRFARINLDAARMQALERLVWRPKSASKQDEQRKAGALQKVFDGVPEPEKAMLQHYRASSDPLDKWLVAGPWGHEYLNRRHISSENFDRELCAMLTCEDSAAGKIVLSYNRLRRAIDEVEEIALKMKGS